MRSSRASEQAVAATLGPAGCGHRGPVTARGADGGRGRRPFFGAGLRGRRAARHVPWCGPAWPVALAVWLGLASAAGAQDVGEQVDYGGAGGSWTDEEAGGVGSVRVERQVPATHRVRPGETLWSLSERYFGDAEQWPKLWALNPEITNPHWIYPDDVVRLRPEGEAQPQPEAHRIEEHAPRRPSGVPRTVRLEEMGWLDADAVREGGKVQGSPTDRALLTTHDPVYVAFEDAGRIEPGLTLTVYEDVPPEERIEGERGHLVRVVGSLRVQRVDRARGIARAIVTEAYDPIERGMPVARIDRSYQVVQPVPAARNLRTQVVAVLRPRHMVGSYQLVFVPVGAAEGVRRGHRFWFVRRGDAWIRSYREVNVPPGVLPQHPVPAPRERDYPEETLGVGIVVGTRPHSSAVLVLEARSAVGIGDEAQLRAGQ